MLESAFIIAGTALILLADIKSIADRTAEKRDIGQYQIRLGYQDGFFKKPLIADMEITPHIFVCGLSGQGKTKMIEYAMRDKNVVLLNVFGGDMRSLKKTLRVNGNERIQKYLDGILYNIYRRKQPLYIVIDELLVLCDDKKIEKSIKQLLAVGRHYNIYLVGICQVGTKETVKFKDLFNTRVCFRQVEESSYRVVLGYSPPDTLLQKREFFLYSDQIARGRTYTI